MEYPCFLTPDSKPFDPVWLAKVSEKIVTREGEEGQERKYTAFYSVPVYRGIATGYAVGCCLRCFYCWSPLSRDFPERYGRFYSPREAFRLLVKAAREGIRYGPPYWRRLKIDKCRISGCEPTIGQRHLLALLDLVEESSFRLFILETNGILIGYDKSYARDLSKYSKVHVRVSIKAGTPEGFTKRTGARGEFYELPFKALEHLMDAGVSCHAAAMTDPRIMSREERRLIIERLAEIDAWLAANLEEEAIDPYDTTLLRLAKAGVKIDFSEETK